MAADTGDETTEDENHQAHMAQFRLLAKSSIKNATYSRVTGEEDYECCDQKRSWTPRVDDFPQEWAG